MMNWVTQLDKHSLGEIIYVLHCFQKKSKHGIETPKQEIELIKKRLKEAEIMDQGD